MTDKPTPYTFSAFMQSAEDVLKTDLSSAAERELGILIDLASSAVDEKDKAVPDEIALALEAIRNNKVEVAQTINERIAKQQGKATGFLGSASAKITIGLLVFIYVAMPVTYKLSNDVFRQVIEGLHIGQLLLVSAAGSLGSVVSVLIRLHRFEGEELGDPALNYMIGFFKPFIGAVFGMFVYLAYKSKIITLTAAGSEIHFLLALAFVSGFSERLAMNIVSQTENFAVPKQKKKKDEKDK